MPPPPPDKWVASVMTVDTKAAEQRDHEIAELRRLRMKYPNA